MKIILKIIRYELHDLIRSKWLISYGLFFWVVTDLLFRFGSSGASVVVSLMNIVLIIIPLVSLIFGMIYLYNSREFMELLLTQPVDRKQVFLGMFLGLSLPLSMIYLIGIYLPVLYMKIDIQSINAYLNLGVTGLVLTLIFTALASYFSTRFEDKIKGLGFAVLLWLFFVVIYDGIILIILFLFADYPLDNISIVFSLINPVNLGRIFLLLQLDVSALMGYTGAVFARFFGGSTGIIVSLFSMMIWVFTPILLGQQKFLKKDF